MVPSPKCIFRLGFNVNLSPPILGMAILSLRQKPSLLLFAPPGTALHIDSRQPFYTLQCHVRPLLRPVFLTPVPCYNSASIRHYALNPTPCIKSNTMRQIRHFLEQSGAFTSLPNPRIRGILSNTTLHYLHLSKLPCT